MKFLSAFWCLSVLFVSSYAEYSHLITPCKWDDRECLKKSCQEAIPKFAAGIPELGMAPLDPIKVDKVSMHESGVHIDFLNVVVTHLKNCKVDDVERTKDNLLRFAISCPILATGDYMAKGNILLQDINGHGPFLVETNNIWIQVTVKIDSENGHWKVSNVNHEFEFKEKTHLNFENLFDGDKERSDLVQQLINDNWKEFTGPFGKDIIKECVTQVMTTIQTLLKQVAAVHLEIQ